MATCKFKDFLLMETFINYLDTPSDMIKKRYVAKTVYDMIQTAYAAIGGIRGRGFGSPEDMIENMKLWKLYRKDGKIRAVALYREKMGRKRVAIASDGTPEGKAGLARIVREDMEQERAFAEISGGSLTFLKKQVGDVAPFAKTAEEAEKILAPDEILYPVDDDDPEVRKHPELKKFFYQRDIGGHWHTKILVGVPFIQFYKKE